MRFFTKVFVGKLCFHLLRVRSGRIQNLLDNGFYRCQGLNQVLRALSEGKMLFRISDKKNPLPPLPRSLFTLSKEEDSSETFVYLYQTSKRPDTEDTNHDG